MGRSPCRQYCRSIWARRLSDNCPAPCPGVVSLSHADSAVYLGPQEEAQTNPRVFFYRRRSCGALSDIFCGGMVRLHSPVFRVDNVVVQGNSAVASADVIALAQASADAGHNVFAASLTFNNMLLWPDVIPQKELQLIPQLAGVTVNKDYFSHTITLTVTLSGRRSAYGVSLRRRAGRSRQPRLSAPDLPLLRVQARRAPALPRPRHHPSP